jgi:hypothetical protein
MNVDPSTHDAAGNGKDSSGRFAKGNRLGRGNPLAGRAAKIRAELFRMSTREDVRAICQKLIDGAKQGDLAYIREWFDRTVGKPTDVLTEQRVSALEEFLRRSEQP